MGKPEESQSKSLRFANNSSPAFEITVVLKNHSGEPLLDKDGNEKTKNFKTNSSFKAWEFYQRYQGKPRRKKKFKTDAKHLPKADEANKLQVIAAKYAEKQQVNRDNKQHGE